MKINKQSFVNHIYVFILLAFSGNPFFNPGEGISQYFFIGIVLVLLFVHNNYLNPKRSPNYYKFLLFFIAIFGGQYIFLGHIAIPGAIGFLLKLTLGYIIIRQVGQKFIITYFNVIFFISFISLIGYLWNLSGHNIPYLYYIERDSLAYNNAGRNLIIFNQKGEGLRNSGMFWEPGAFACYINLAFLLLIGNIRLFIVNHKSRLVIILLALLSTFSTTGYLILFFIIMATLYIEYGKKLGILIIPTIFVFSIIGYVVFEKSDFLRDKIEHQFQIALDRDRNEFAPDRLSALIFDLHYIKKHPLIGNGMDEATRYADHPWLQEKSLGHGNGFSNFIATMGILSLLFYSIYILKYKRKHSFVFIGGIFALLQGEPLLNYPLFLSIPFIFIYGKYYFSSSNLSQQKTTNIRISSSFI